MANPELTHQPSSFDTKAHALVRATTSPSTRRRSATRQLARGLGWFGIGLGLVELFAARPLARRVGLQGSETLLRAYGLREIVNGIGILASRQPQAASAWVGARVAGDVLDLTTLAGAALAPRPPGSHPVAALVAVAGVAALDLVCARTLQHEANAANQTTDYSDRAGLGGAAPEDARGAALATFTQPPDMRVSATNGLHLPH